MTEKRDLHIDKRDLYIDKKTYILTKEAYIYCAVLPGASARAGLDAASAMSK